MNSPEPSAAVTFEEFKKLDARVGTITLVERVPRTEKLYKIPSQLTGKRVVFLYNLKPTKFAGEVSQGMLLAAELNDKLSLLTTDHEIPNGAKIT
jgi:tRNA-binding EMAP/Myf-like protein